MTEQEKFIYNTYIAVTRSKQNKPFKLRKDFTDFKHAAPLSKLASFFKRYPHIKPEEFFKAPYEVYSDTEYLELNYFLTRAAIKAYSLYQQKLRDVSPDLQIEDIKKSLQFIGSFCLKHKIYAEDYLNHKTGCVYSWMMHYREHYINVYSVFELGNIMSHLSQVAADEKRIFVDDLQQTLGAYLTRYHKSTLAKNIVQQGTEKIKKFLKEHLIKTQTKP